MKVLIGSRNPVKIDAVRMAFESVWPGRSCDFCPLEVDSGVHHQPFGDRETLQGARNRVRSLHSLDVGDLAVGLEGGIVRIAGTWFDRGWAIVADRNGKEGVGSTVSLLVPNVVVKEMKQGKGLGKATDAVFNLHKSKEGASLFGLLTDNIITRTTAYRDAVILALVPFVRTSLFT